MNLSILSADSPLQNSPGEFRLELDFEAEGGGGDGLEGDGVELVHGDAVVAGGFDGFPVVAGFIEQLPALRHAAGAFAGVVEPIHVRRGKLRRLFKGALDPLGGAFVIPPRHARNFLVVGFLRQLTVEAGLDAVAVVAERSRPRLRRDHRAEPRLHLNRAAVLPHAIRNQRQRVALLL